MQNNHVFRILIFAVLALLAAVFLTGCADEMKKAEETRDLEIKDPDLEAVSDGTYEGFYDAGLVKVKVETTALNGEIKAVDLLRHQNGRGKPAEAIVDDVIEEQSLEVDVISGATISSKAILKAIERSLKQGIE
jgi:uncharacterized protein with FMN-binding domain